MPTSVPDQVVAARSRVAVVELVDSIAGPEHFGLLGAVVGSLPY